MEKQEIEKLGLPFKSILLKPFLVNFYLFIWGLTSLSTHCTGRIMIGTFMGAGNQSIQLVSRFCIVNC